MLKPDPISHSTLEALTSGRVLRDDERQWLSTRLRWIEVPTGCWEWVGKRFNVGYGIVYVGNVATPAQRAAYAIAFGSIPKGMCVCHRCDNRPCVNPAHLFVGSKGDNARDRTAKGRTLKGERHASTKLTDAQVSEILRRGGPQRALASEFGVGKTQIARILRGESRV